MVIDQFVLPLNYYYFEWSGLLFRLVWIRRDLKFPEPEVSRRLKNFTRVKSIKAKEKGNVIYGRENPVAQSKRSLTQFQFQTQ